MAFIKDPLRIHLSIVSHTNIGKTTLARTLLGQDVGEIQDAPHVTENTDDYVLARGPAGCELILWDTPGFGNSITLLKRLRAHENPVGWVLSEVWDRLTNKSFWLNQKAIRHVKETSNVVLYLVNSTDFPDKTPYILAELEILSWLKKPVIVLLNQMGKPLAPTKEAELLTRWQSALSIYPFISSVLPMDAFARCWVQEVTLFNAIGKSLPSELQATFEVLRDAWTRARRASYTSSVDAMANHIVALIHAKETAPAQTVKDYLITFAKHRGLFKNNNQMGPLEDAQNVLGSMATDRLCTLTNKLIEINALSGESVSKVLLKRLKSDWKLSYKQIDPTLAAALGAVGGATATGVATDLLSGGLTMGLGTLIGGVVGALSGLGVAGLYNAQKAESGIEVFWSEKAIKNFLLETLLLYLAVAHFGRGRGEWQEGEYPLFWKETLIKRLVETPFPVEKFRNKDADETTAFTSRYIDTLLRQVFAELYHQGL